MRLPVPTDRFMTAARVVFVATMVAALGWIVWMLLQQDATLDRSIQQVERQQEKIAKADAERTAIAKGLARANQKLTSLGEPPVLITGPTGPSGPAGASATRAQVLEAVTLWCSTSNTCEGKRPTRAQVAVALRDYCAGRAQCLGPAGADGQDGADGTDGTDGEDGQDGATGPQGPGPSAEQIATAVAEFCGEGNCDGESAFPFEFTFPVEGHGHEVVMHTVTCVAPNDCTTKSEPQ